MHGPVQERVDVGLILQRILSLMPSRLEDGFAADSAAGSVCSLLQCLSVRLKSPMAAILLEERRSFLDVTEGGVKGHAEAVLEIVSSGNSVRADDEGASQRERSRNETKAPLQPYM